MCLVGGLQETWGLSSRKKGGTPGKEGLSLHWNRPLSDQALLPAGKLDSLQEGPAVSQGPDSRQLVQGRVSEQASGGARMELHGGGGEVGPGRAGQLRSFSCPGPSPPAQTCRSRPGATHGVRGGGDRLTMHYCVRRHGHVSPVWSRQVIKVTMILA